MNASATLLTLPAVADRDQRLLEAAQRGDLDAFEAIVRRHQRRVYSLAWHGVRDQMLAEELAQDVFMQLHAHLDRITSAAHLTSWLRRTTTHRVIDTLRVRRLSRSLDEIREPQVAPSPGDPFADRLVHRAMARLAPQARLVVMLRYMDDLAPTEIADTLGMSINTVKSHLRRALLVLRARMQRERQS